MRTRATIESQQQALLAACNDLGDAAALADFKSAVRALLAAEAEWLATAPAAVREEQQAEAEEFEAFADEVLQADLFDAAELKRFATAWTLGHIRGAAGRLDGAGIRT